MSKIPVVTPDAARIRELIEASQWRAVAPFARSLRNPRRHDQSIRNIANGTVTVVGREFMRQIARKLKVDLTEITIAEPGEGDGEQPEAEAEAQMREMPAAEMAAAEAA